MIPYELDPSLHTTQPQEPKLDDGFSRPEEPQAHAPQDDEAGEATIGDKSAF